MPFRKKIVSLNLQRGIIHAFFSVSILDDPMGIFVMK